jgi:hypothetical protein
MAITLNVSVGTTDTVLVLSAAPNSPALKIDSEEFGVVSATSPVVGRADMGRGMGYPAADVTVQVQRAWNGTDRAPHTSGATVTPIWEAMTATPGTLV